MSRIESTKTQDRLKNLKNDSSISLRKAGRKWQHFPEKFTLCIILGFQMPAWFDLFSLDPSGQEDERGIDKSKQLITSLIEEEINNGIDPSRIMLGGFSQGGALSLYIGLSGKYKLAGVMALSCWLPLHKSFPGALNTSNAEVPILQAHGDCDPVVPYRWGQLTSTTIKNFVKSHEFKTYKGLGHSSGAAELQDIAQFLQERLPPNE